MTPTIICHRGWWTTAEEQNTLAAFERAFDAGLGVELDVRDLHGGLVVSHDPPKSVSETDPNTIWFWQVLDLLEDRTNLLAVNVKSCGLAPLFGGIEEQPNWFFFDVAPGDEEPYLRRGLPLYVRGRWEADPVLLVSWEILYPDEEPALFWHAIKERPNDRTVFLVTDRPDQCREFFK